VSPATLPEPAVQPPADAATAFVLSRLAAAPDGRLGLGELNKRLGTKAAAALGLSGGEAARARDALVGSGHLSVERAGRRVAYLLTEAGRARLDELGAATPSVPRGRFNPPSNNDVQDARTAYLLLQLLQADSYTLTAAEANKPTAQARDLELNAATAAHLRRELAREGLLTVARLGRSERYTLTAAGRRHLGTLTFHPDLRFPLTGRALNALLDAAREAARPAPSGDGGGGRVPTAADVSAAVLEEVAALRREKYAVTGLVPIPEVRAAVRDRLGPAAARHDVFDEAALGLWRAGRARLVPIADRSKATPDQLRDAIPGVGETLFYLDLVP
jgi:DNA-binding MarR family transcriptional regulator